MRYEKLHTCMRDRNLVLMDAVEWCVKVTLVLNLTNLRGCRKVAYASASATSHCPFQKRNNIFGDPPTVYCSFPELLQLN